MKWLRQPLQLRLSHIGVWVFLIPIMMMTAPSAYSVTMSGETLKYSEEWGFLDRARTDEVELAKDRKTTVIKEVPKGVGLEINYQEEGEPEKKPDDLIEKTNPVAFSISGGVNMMDTSAENTRLGFAPNVALNVWFGINQYFTLRTGFVYFPRNNNYDLDFDSDSYQAIEIPVLALPWYNLTFSHTYYGDLYGILGIGFNIQFSAKHYRFSAETDIMDMADTFYASFHVGLGYQYYFDSFGGLFLEVNYNLAMNSTIEQGSMRIREGAARDIVLSFGYTMEISGYRSLF